MTTKWHKRLLVVIGLLAISLALPAEVRARRPKNEQPSPLFKGAAIPEAPMQKKPWTPPQSRVPEAYVSAVTTLFQQGLADPRGCEYRLVNITLGSIWTGDAGVGTVRGWVLPEKPGDKDRFAVLMDGSVYPVVLVGKKLDLKAEVHAAIREAKGGKGETNLRRARLMEDSKFGDDRAALIYGPFAVPFLLRLGEGELATAVWEAQPRAGKEGEEAKESYSGMTSEWAWELFETGLCAHMRGDDKIALHHFRLLSAIAGPVEEEAKKRGYKADKDRGERRLLHFLDQLPDILADQERRAKRGPLSAVVCIGPGRESNQSKRIAALIERLEEVSARQSGQPGGVSLGNDPIVQALVREGEPAVEPLLFCFEKDNRLTRSVHFWRDFARSRTVLGVHEAAYVALGAILHRFDYEPVATGDNLTSAGNDQRRQLAARMRDYLKKTERVPFAERWFRVLADDKATPEKWLDAVSILVSPDDVTGIPGTMVGTGGSEVRIQSPSGGKPKLKGEPLRVKKDPNVSELLLKRIKQTEDVGIAAGLSAALGEWDRRAGLPAMAEQMKRCRDAGKWYAYVSLVEARVAAGDRAALDDYASWVRSTTPTMVKEDDAVFTLLQMLWLHRDHPGMAAAAEHLFNKPGSPWLPLLRTREPDFPASGLFGLAGTGALRLAGFRKAVLKELDNKEAAGTVTLKKDGFLIVSPPDYALGSRYYEDPELPAQDKEVGFRFCDYFAWEISEKIKGAPRCELYWDEKRRDAAVTACKEFLLRFGDRLGPGDLLGAGLDLPRLDKPATPEQVKQGQAIFSLAGEGKVRLVKLPKVPMFAEWITLKDHPYKYLAYEVGPRARSMVTGFHQSGLVWQAEEVLKDGKWQRYYGFVGSHKVARVPAAEIEFEDESWWGGGWVALGGKIDGRLEISAPSSEDEESDPRFAADAPLLIELKLRNRGGLDETIPSLDGVRLRVWYSAEVVSPQGRLVPGATRDADWKELPAKHGTIFKATDERPLSPAETRLACKVDLRSRFEFIRSGFYRVRLTAPSEKNEKDAAADVRFSLKH